MNKSKVGLSGLVDHIVGRNSTGLDMSRYVRSLSLSAGTHTTTVSRLPPSSLGLGALSQLSTRSVKAIPFGKPSSGNSSSSSVAGGWQSLLSKTVSGGASSLMGGGFSGVAGLGGLFSDIAGLFGGSSKPQPPPLTRFSLSDSIQETVALNASMGNVHTTPAQGIYASNVQISNTSRTQLDPSAIAQAVKDALLTSNTLGDVIAEL